MSRDYVLVTDPRDRTISHVFIRVADPRCLGIVTSGDNGYEAKAEGRPIGFPVDSLAAGAEALVQSHDARMREFYQPKLVSNVYG